MYWWKDDSEPAPGFGDLMQRSKVPLTLADVRLPDAPLIGVNEAFCQVTQYAPELCLGRNCRFLQPAGGAGPVRQRMRDFIANDRIEDGKFLVPNVRADGSPFLNLVYMTKLQYNNEIAYIFGSQFEIRRHGEEALQIYETALKQDIRQLGSIAGEMGIVMLGTYEQLASSHSIIAKLRMSGLKGDG